MEFYGPAKRLTILIGESDRWKQRPLWMALLETLKREGLAGATVLRGLAGFGAHSRIHTATLEALSVDLPVVVVVVDQPERIERVLPIVGPMVQEGLITLEDVQVLKYTHRVLTHLPKDRRVRDVMSREVATVRPETPLAQVVTMLLERGIKAVPVVNENGQVAGIITGGDLLARGELGLRLGLQLELPAAERQEVMRDLEAKGLSAADVMTSPVITVAEKATLEEAAHLMLVHNLKRLPVIDERQRLVGIISRIDVLRTVAQATRVGAVTPETLPTGATWVREVMSRDVPTVRPETPLPEVLEQVVATPFRRVVVADAEGRVQGIILDSVLLRQVEPEVRPGLLQILAQRLVGREVLHPKVAATTAAQVMEPQVLTVSEDDTLAVAIQRMVEHRTKRLVVLNAQGRLAGILDRQTALRALLSPTTFEATSLTET
ncbi:MAG: DUF190 domain-containing protein [Chloroflexota bacterium]